MKILSKEEYIKFLRREGFNCFPIPEKQKEADYRYKASRTIENQPISKAENYGYIPIKGKGTAIIDIDSKEKYREFAENTIKAGFMVVETGKGWHIPVKGLLGNISKIELFNYKFQDKKIVEIQGIDHYCIGIGSEIFHNELKEKIIYENKGSLKIWSAEDKDFHNFVDTLCKNLEVTPRKRTSRSSYAYQRERFSQGLLPAKGSSNDYFHQSAIQCLTDGLTKDEALEKIQIIYDKWTKERIRKCFGNERY